MKETSKEGGRSNSRGHSAPELKKQQERGRRYPRLGELEPWRKSHPRGAVVRDRLHQSLPEPEHKAGSGQRRSSLTLLFSCPPMDKTGTGATLRANPGKIPRAQGPRAQRSLGTRSWQGMG